MAGASLISALVVNFTIGVIKMTVGVFTKSAAMTSEAIHSFADTFNQILLAVGIQRSKRVPDPEHPFGYAKVQFFWAFVVAVLIFGISGTLAFLEGIEIIRHPDEHNIELDKIGWNILVLAVAIVLEFFAWKTAYNEARHFKDKHESETLFEALDDMQDPVLLSLIVEDTLALVGLVIALIGVLITFFTQAPIVDGYTSMFIGIILMVGGLLLARENKAYLVGKAVAPQIRGRILEIVNSFEGIKEIKSIKSMLLGPVDMILSLDLVFEDSIENPATAIDQLEKILADEIEHLTPEKIFIEVQ